MRKNLTYGGVAQIDRNTIATHEIVAAVAGKRIVPVALVLSAFGAQTVELRSNGVVIGPALSFAANGGMVAIGDGTVQIAPASAVGQNFQIALTAAIRVTGWLVYGLDEG